MEEKNNNKYLHELSTIVEPNIIDAISAIIESQKWLDLYRMYIPDVCIDSDLKTIKDKESDTNIIIERPWTELYRLLAFINDVLITPHILKYEGIGSDGYETTISKISHNIYELNYLQAFELSKILSHKLDYYVFQKTFLPLDFNLYGINEKWEILVQKDVDDINVLLISRAEIEETVMERNEQLGPKAALSALPEKIADKIKKNKSFMSCTYNLSNSPIH